MTGTTSPAVDRVLDLLRQRGPVVLKGSNWRCVCPAHDDTTPSLDVMAGRDGRVLFQCRSRGCTSGAITSAIGLTIRDLFADDHGAAKASFEERIVCTYPYRDETGKELFQAVRLWAPPPKNKDFRQRRRDGKKWAWSLGNVRRVLYRLPELLAADPGAIVYVCEGEKDVENMVKCGLVATTNPMGAGKWKREYAEFLRGRHVVILQDNDDAGRDHAEAVRESLVGVVASAKIVQLPSLPEKGDVSDWIQAEVEGSGESLDFTAIGAKLARFCAEYQHEQRNGVHHEPIDPEREAEKGALPLLFYADVQPALNTADFVEDLLIDGAMSVVYGESGCGKTFFMLDLALHVAAGLTWRDRAVEQRGILYLALEGSHGIRNRISAFRRAHDILDLPLAVVPIALDLRDASADTERVIDAAKRAAIRLSRPVGMIVVDTLSRGLAGGNENDPVDMGGFVRNVDRIRQELPAHTSIIHHCGKDTAKGARGWSGLRAATDTEIEVSHDAATRTSTAKVTKQRDLDCSGEFPFRLESVHLGTNRRGKPVASCVVRAIAAEEVNNKAEEGRIERARQKMEAEQRKVLQAIDAECQVHDAATKSAIRPLAGLGLQKVSDILASLVDSGAVEEIEFEKKVGQGAKQPAKGFRRVAS